MFRVVAINYTSFIINDKHSCQKFLLNIPYNKKINKEFLNADKKDVSLEYIKQNYDFFGPIVEGFGLLNFIPDIANGIISKKTTELCRIACEQNGFALQYVPDMTPEGVSLKTPELCKTACEQDGCALSNVPDELKTYELCKMACEKDGSALQDVPDEYKTLTLCEIACEQDFTAIEYVPKDLITPELCKMVTEKWNEKNETIILDEDNFIEQFKRLFS